MKNFIWQQFLLVAALFYLVTAVPPGRRQNAEHEADHDLDFIDADGNLIDNNVSNERRDFPAYGRGHQDSEPRKWFEAVLGGSGRTRNHSGEHQHHSGEHPHRHIRKNVPTARGSSVHPINKEASSPLAQTLGNLKRVMFNHENSRIIPMNISELRPSTCSMKPFQQTIAHPGCGSVTIQNHMCYGQCDSFYIPFVDNKFVSCSTCAPSKWETQTIELQCSDSGSEEVQTVRKRVEIIQKCDCLPCSTNRAPLDGQ